jgi:predicted phosphohydrolase
MNIWAISDLHLSFAQPERRDRFAARWRDHVSKIESQWREVVGAGDLVLLPGDVSMARNHRDLQPDLAWLDCLPGVKVLSRGNHDQWWNGVDAVRRLLRSSLRAVDGDAVSIQGAVVCGAAGMPVSSGPARATPQAAGQSAIKNLEQALEHALRLRTKPDGSLYVLWHYPPFDAHARPGPCVELLQRAEVTACVYGHLHNESEWPAAVQGLYRGVRYHCVAADAIGFRPLRINRSET